MERKRDRRPARPEPTREPEPERPAGTHGALLDLQRRAGNAAVSSVVGRPRPGPVGGAPLPASAGPARAVLGDLADDVRVHQAGDGGPEVPAGALAATHGTDIAVAAGAPGPDTPAGSLLLAHESAHVVQQTAAGGHDETGGAEDQADRAAVAAMAGRPVPRLGRASGVQYFEAPKHQASITNAMAHVGFSDAEQQHAYLGNWCRDMSQAMVPMLNDTIGVQATMTLVSSVAQMKFGQPVTPAQLGMYDPVEHMDNPTGLVNRDLLQNRLGSLDKGLPLDPGAPTDIAVAGRGAFGTPQRDVSPAAIGELMAANAAGVPAYIEQSRGYVKDQIRAALAEGRSAEGLFRVGNFSHVVEDLFAHSNWIEMAVGDLIRTGEFPLDPLSDGATSIAGRKEMGQPPIETYAGSIASAGGRARPVLMTGSFAPGAKGHDTLISLKAEAQNVLSGIEPFAPDGSTEKWWDFGTELLGNVDAAAAEGDLGVIFADHVRQIGENLGIGQAITSFTGGLERGARRTFGEGMLGDLAAGAAGLVHGAATATVDAGGEAWSDHVLPAIREGTDMLGARMDLVKVAYYLKHGGEEIEQAWGVVKEAVTKLPSEIRDRLLPALTKAEKAFKEKLRALLNTAYKRGVETLIDAIEGAIGRTDVAESPMARKIEELERQLGPEGDLRKNLVEAIRDVAPGDAGAAMVARIQTASPPQLVALANSPDLRNFLATLAETDRPAVRAAIESMEDAGQRIQQFGNLPPWAKEGASHSQLAKDHADSPFFGAAFTMANNADRRLMALLAQGWREMGQPERAPGLEGSLPNEQEEEGEHLDPLIDTAAMDRQRGRDFHETRDMGKRILDTGHADVLPSALIAEVARALGAEYDALHEDAARYPVARTLSRKLKDLIDTLRGTPSGRLVEAKCLALEQWIAANIDTKSASVLRTAAATVAGLLDRLEHLIAELGDKEDEPHEAHVHESHDPAQRSEAHYDRQVRALQDQRAGLGMRLDTGARTATAADRAVDAAGSTQEKLDAEVDRIIDHPFESMWWRADLASWLKDHQREVSQWIVDRNSGRIHSH